MRPTPARPRPRLAFTALLTAAVITGCRVGPDYVPPDVDLPDAWHRKLAEGLSSGDANLSTWWKTLRDKELDDLIARVGESNLDVEIAFARVKEARAMLQIAGGYRLPDLNGVGSAVRSKIGSNRGVSGSGATNNFYSTGMDTVWEIDVWGRVSRIVETAAASLDASIENLRDVLVVLYADVALNYVELRALQDRIRLAAANIVLQQDTLKLTQDRFNAQLVSELDVRQAELNLARTQAIVPALREAREAAIHRISVLLGGNPGSLHAELSAAGKIPSSPASVTVTVPYDLVRQRPDVRRAERELAAQTARIGIATADLYPQFSLFGAFSFDSVGGNVTDMFRKSSLSWSFGPQFSWNLFSGGRVQGNIEAEKARTDQLVAVYKQTILLALEETENALVAYTEEIQTRDALLRSTTAARKSVELVQTLYRTGTADFQNVLDMQRSLVQEEDGLAASEGRVIQDLIRIYKALGGGWDPEALDANDRGNGEQESRQPK